MDFKKLIDRGKKIVDERGGTESLKQDAEELQRIAKGKGSLSEKAKEAAAAIKEPGSKPPESTAAPHPEGASPGK